MDELGFYRLAGQANSDEEVQTSIRRGQLGFRNPKLVKISTPYLKSGVLWEDHANHYGQDSPDVLVWQASSQLMNPTLREDRLEQVQRLDPQRFAREYLAEFSDDLTAFLPLDWITDAVVDGRYELPPQEGTRYTAACDPSGGGADTFGFSLVHSEGEGKDQRIVQDVLRGWKRVGKESPDLRAVVSKIAGLCREYRVSRIMGDRYSAGWVRQSFAEEGITYEPAKHTKAEAYLEALPLFSRGQLELLDHSEMMREFQCLERRTRAGGRDIVDHPRAGHDDYSNVTALAAVTHGSAWRPPDKPISMARLRGRAMSWGV
jgi:hypothetical protein